MKAWFSPFEKRAPTETLAPQACRVPSQHPRHPQPGARGLANCVVACSEFAGGVSSLSSASAPAREVALARCAVGHPVTLVSEMLGHSQTSTTLDVYGHAIPATLRQVADALEAVVAG